MGNSVSINLSVEIIYSYTYTTFLSNNKNFSTLLRHNLNVLGNLLISLWYCWSWHDLQVLHVLRIIFLLLNFPYVTFMFYNDSSLHLHLLISDKLSTSRSKESFICLALSINFKLYVTYFFFELAVLLYTFFPDGYWKRHIFISIHRYTLQFASKFFC